jgi:transposase
VLSQKDNHEHSLSSILDKLSRKKKGSKAFKRAQIHRKNFVHWSVNQINFEGVKEVRLEKVVNIRFGKKSSRKMSHWSNPEIRDKIKRKCEKLGGSSRRTILRLSQSEM